MVPKKSGNERFGGQQMKIMRELELRRRDESLRGLKGYRHKQIGNRFAARVFRTLLVRKFKRLELKRRDGVSLK